MNGRQALLPGITLPQVAPEPLAQGVAAAEDSCTSLECAGGAEASPAPDVVDDEGAGHAAPHSLADLPLLCLTLPAATAATVNDAAATEVGKDAAVLPPVAADDEASPGLPVSNDAVAATVNDTAASDVDNEPVAAPVATDDEASPGLPVSNDAVVATVNDTAASDVDNEPVAAPVVTDDEASAGSPAAKDALVAAVNDAAASDAGKDAVALPPVVVVGLGIGDSPQTGQHADAIHKAEVLVGGRRQLAPYRNHPARQVVIASPLDDVLDAIARHQEAGRQVVVLADGDPLFFGIGARLVARFGEAALHVLPGVSSLQAAASRLGLAWNGVTSVSLHGRHDWRPLTAAVLGGGPVCVLTDGVNTPDVIARYLIDRGVDWYRVHVFEDMGTADEQGYALSLPACAALDFGPCCTMLLLPEGTLRGPQTGTPDADFTTEAGLLTKWPVRSVALGALRIAPGHTVWDLGAGSGAMTMECAAVARQGRVVAVERDAGRVVCIEENRRRMGAVNVDVVHGDAAQSLGELPDPDRIFVGGGLGRHGGEHVLRMACARLLPGGRIVASCVLFGSVSLALEVFADLGWKAEVVCIQASVSAPLAGDLRLTAMNPVHLVMAERPFGRVDSEDADGASAAGEYGAMEFLLNAELASCARPSAGMERPGGARYAPGMKVPLRAAYSGSDERCVQEERAAEDAASPTEGEPVRVDCPCGADAGVDSGIGTGADVGASADTVAAPDVATAAGADTVVDTVVDAGVPRAATAEEVLVTGADAGLQSDAMSTPCDDMDETFFGQSRSVSLFGPLGKEQL